MRKLSSHRLQHAPRVVVIAVLGILLVVLAPHAGASSLKEQFFAQAGMVPLALGLLLIVVALIMEWNTIVNLANIENVPLATIERSHPRLPNIREVFIALLLSAVLGIFIAQFLINIYASRYVPDEPVLTEYDAQPLIIISPQEFRAPE